jgi:hypothetical protein
MIWPQTGIPFMRKTPKKDTFHFRLDTFCAMPWQGEKNRPVLCRPIAEKMRERIATGIEGRLNTRDASRRLKLSIIGHRPVPGRSSALAALRLQLTLRTEGRIHQVRMKVRLILVYGHSAPHSDRLSQSTLISCAYQATARDSARLAGDEPQAWAQALD